MDSIYDPNTAKLIKLVNQNIFKIGFDQHKNLATPPDLICSEYFIFHHKIRSRSDGAFLDVQVANQRNRFCTGFAYLI